MSISIKAENLSKAYQLGEFSTGTVSRDIERWWLRMRGKEDPFLKIGEVNDRTQKGISNTVWSLKDINFEIEQGDTVGIIGRNGAGKSTLLKVLSRVTTPTSGSIKVKGRIASLLEVGTGFHPELTGRENVFLNGAILGMRKTEIRKHFDAIVDFAGIERYIDTPVKRYSSGMYVRLAFAVAAHLDSEILIVDEVLAVGDAEFQKKCMGKMSDLSTGEGRTVLFVSHNMAAVAALCTTGILMEKGSVKYHGAIESVIQTYTTYNKQKVLSRAYQNSNGVISLNDIRLKGKDGKEKTHILSGDHVEIELHYRNDSKEAIVPSIGFYDFADTPLFLCAGMVKSVMFPNVIENVVSLCIDKFPLPEGEYYLNIELAGTNHRYYMQQAYKLDVENGDFYNTGILPNWKKGVMVDYNWR